MIFQSFLKNLESPKLVAENNDKTMNAGWQVQMLQDVSNHYRSHHTNTDSNYNANIEGRLNTKISLAEQQNAIHEIGLKYQHLRDDENNNKNNEHELTTDKVQAENFLNENQLLVDDTIELSSNNNFQPEKWTSYDNNFHSVSIDSSSLPQLFHVNDAKRSSGHMQKQSKAVGHYDDQMSKEKNDLWDEIGEKLSKAEQQGLQLVPFYPRVKRRDAINQSNEGDVNEIEMNEIGNNRFISDHVNDDDDKNNDGDYEDFIMKNSNGEHEN